MHEEILIPFGAFAFVTLIITIVTIGKQFGRHRELSHKERLRSIEMGHAPHGGSFWPSIAAIAIGACVPVMALGIAFVANLTHSGGKEAWAFAGIIGATAIGCGTYLATRLLNRNQGTSNVWDAPDASDWHAAKPQFDPDAYDTVGRRG